MAASDSRISVLLDQESAQTRFGIFVFLGAAERIALYMLSFCLSLTVFLPWPTRQAFSPGGEVLDLEFR